MATQQTNVYRLTAYLKSLLSTGDSSGTQVAVVAATPEGAVSIVQDSFGDDLQNYSGPTLAIQGAYTSMSGDVLNPAEAQAVAAQGVHAPPAAAAAASSSSPAPAPKKHFGRG